MTVALVFSALLVAAPQEAWAAEPNTKDRPYSFTFKGSNTQGTRGRKKNDISPVYVQVKVFTVDAVTFYVDGGKSKNGPWYNLTVNGKARLTQTKHSSSKARGKYCIHTLVREAGYSHARLTGWTNGYRGKVKGVWSPDSMYTYVSLN